MQRLGAWIRYELAHGDKARKRGRKITIEEAAAGADLHPSSLWKVMVGRISDPHVSFLVKLATFFEVPLWLMLKEIEEGWE